MLSLLGYGLVPHGQKCFTRMVSDGTVGTQVRTKRAPLEPGRPSRDSTAAGSCGGITADAGTTKTETRQFPVTPFNRPISAYFGGGLRGRS